jgi:hypothetical protein
MYIFLSCTISLWAQQVLWTTFILSDVFDAIAQRTQLLTVIAINDILTMDDWVRMRM